MDKDPKILKQKVAEGYLTANLYDNGVIEILWDKTIETIEVDHLSKMQQTVAELSGGKRMPLLFTPHDFLHLSKEGGKFATSDDGTRYSLAIAVVVDNLAKKLLMNFFLSINKPKVPTKGCSTKADSFKWLESIKTPA